jgi:hypothetical protein
MQLIATGRLPMKRSASHMQPSGPSISRGPSNVVGPSRYLNDQPPAKVAALSSSNPRPVVRSNLKQIQCVDEPMPQAYGRTHPSSARSFQQPQQQYGNLRSVPVQANPNLKTLTPSTSEPRSSGLSQPRQVRPGFRRLFTT